MRTFFRHCFREVPPPPSSIYVVLIYLTLVYNSFSRFTRPSLPHYDSTFLIKLRNYLRTKCPKRHRLYSRLWCVFSIAAVTIFCNTIPPVSTKRKKRNQQIRKKGEEKKNVWQLLRFASIRKLFVA